jgi:hypothetical protein
MLKNLLLSIITSVFLAVVIIFPTSSYAVPIDCQDSFNEPICPEVQITPSNKAVGSPLGVNTPFHIKAKDILDKSDNNRLKVAVCKADFGGDRMAIQQVEVDRGTPHSGYMGANLSGLREERLYKFTFSEDLDFGVFPKRCHGFFSVLPPTGTPLQGANLCDNGTPGVQTDLGCVPSSPTSLVNTLFKLALGLAGGIAILFVILGGFKIATSQGDPDALAEGKDTITHAIIGLVFILMATFILGIIGIDILGISLPAFRPLVGR